MKTDDLVAMLSANVEPVERGLVGRAISVAVTVGAVIALGLMLIGLGVRADLTTAHAVIFLLLKIAFAFLVVGVALRYLTRLARPGAQQGTSAFTIALPRTLPALRAALITSGGSSVIRSRRGRQARSCPVVRESIAWRTNDCGLRAAPGLIRPVTLVGDS